MGLRSRCSLLPKPEPHRELPVLAWPAMPRRPAWPAAPAGCAPPSCSAVLGSHPQDSGRKERVRRWKREEDKTVEEGSELNGLREIQTRERDKVYGDVRKKVVSVFYSGHRLCSGLMHFFSPGWSWSHLPGQTPTRTKMWVLILDGATNWD